MLVQYCKHFNMKPILLFTLLSIGLTFSVSSMAQTATPGVTQRQVNQQHRIRQGVGSGELTRREARRMELRQAKVQHDKKVAKSDGVVTPAERRKLRREQNRTSRAIRRQKHDEQTRP